MHRLISSWSIWHVVPAEMKFNYFHYTTYRFNRCGVVSLFFFSSLDKPWLNKIRNQLFAQPLNSQTISKKKKRNDKMSKKKETVKEIFASCCFSSLGLDSTLCDQLRGLFLLILFFGKINWKLIMMIKIHNLVTERLGFEAPTKVQAQAIPVILSGRDV